MIDTFSPILYEESKDKDNNDYGTMFWKLWFEEIETEGKHFNSTIVDTNTQINKVIEEQLDPFLNLSI